MAYPDDFETPANPAGKSIAVSRFVSICTCVVFLATVFLCGLLIWSSRSDRLVPFLISADTDTGEWTVVGRTSATLEYSVERTIQESLVGNFVRDWFNISGNQIENDLVWEMCERAECAGLARRCALYCAADDDLFGRFTRETMPIWQQRMEIGEIRTVDENTISIRPLGKVSDNGGTWQISATIKSNISTPIKITAFAHIAKNSKSHPQTMGFYITDFDAYRIK